MLRRLRERVVCVRLWMFVCVFMFWVCVCKLWRAWLTTSDLVEYVSDLCESDQKFLVFAYHLDVLDALEHEMTKKKGAYTRSQSVRVETSFCACVYVC